MTTKPPAEVKLNEDTDTVKILYTAVDGLQDFIPVHNDRNRLSFCVNLYLNNETETLKSAIEQASPRSCTINYSELEKKIDSILKEKGIERKTISI